MGRPKISGYIVEICGVACVSKSGILSEREFLLPVQGEEAPTRFEINRGIGKAPVEAVRQRVVRSIMRTNRLITLMNDKRYDLVSDTTTGKRLRNIKGEWKIVTYK